jgi:hypothetical protein
MKAGWKPMRIALQMAMHQMNALHDLMEEMQRLMPCDHPEHEREKVPNSTMGNLHYICKLCGNVLDKDGVVVDDG